MWCAPPQPQIGLGWKFPPKKEVTVLGHIVVQVGRTGVLTPVVLLQPFDVGGVNKYFIKNLSEDLKPGSSASFVATRKGNPEIIIEALKSYKEKILQTALSHRNEAKLQQALEKVKD